MLHRRLTVLAAGLLGLTACADGDAVEEAVVEPGLTAVADAAPAAVCAANASALRSAIEAYTLMEGAPPPDEQALVDAGRLREATTEWDVVDGELVVEDPACGPDDQQPVATLDIVTDAEPVDAAAIYAAFDPATIEAVGGEACARELAAIAAAGEAFLAGRGTEPADLDELVAAGELPALPERWELVDAELVPTPDGGCVAPG